jgi:hypothetical protein
VDDQDDVLHKNFPVQVRGYLSKDNPFAKSKLGHRPLYAASPGLGCASGGVCARICIKTQLGPPAAS